MNVVYAIYERDAGVLPGRLFQTGDALLPKLQRGGLVTAQHIDDGAHVVFPKDRLHLIVIHGKALAGGYIHHKHIERIYGGEVVHIQFPEHLGGVVMVLKAILPDVCVHFLLSGLDELDKIGLIVRYHCDFQLDHLADFLFQRHLGDHPVYVFFHLFVLCRANRG